MSNEIACTNGHSFPEFRKVIKKKHGGWQVVCVMCVRLATAKYQAKKRQELKQRGEYRSPGRPPQTLEHKFLSHVIITDGCWIWTGGLGKGGYGKFTHYVNGKPKTQGAYKVSYEMYIGPVPKGLTLDHMCCSPSHCKGGETCPHRKCVNPHHLEPKTSAENVKRGNKGIPKTHCPSGHEMSVDNTYIYKGFRSCRKCRYMAGVSHRNL